MVKLIFIIFFIIYQLILIDANEIIEKIVKNIVHEVGINRLTIHTKNESTSFANLLIKGLINNVTTAIIDEHYVPESIGNKFFLYNKNISSPLHVLLTNANDLKENNLQRWVPTFELLRTSLFYTTRLKCLIVVFENFIPIEYIKAILQLAWKFNFLDFTLLQITKFKCLVAYFNPFNHDFVFSNCAISNINLFPNKLNNMHEYVLQTGVFSLCWPDCYFNSNSDTGKYLVKLYKQYQCFLKSVNATANYVPVLSPTMYLDVLSDNNLNLMLSYDFLMFVDLQEAVIIDFVYIKAIVPIIHEKYLKFS